MSNVDRGIADEAVNIVTGDRPNSYGPPEDNFTNIAYGWAGILLAKFGKEFDPAELVNHPEIVSLMMVSLKVMREAFQHQRDNIVDGVGYWLTTDAVTPKVVVEANPVPVPFNIISVGERPPLQLEDEYLDKHPSDKWASTTATQFADGFTTSVDSKAKPTLRSPGEWVYGVWHPFIPSDGRVSYTTQKLVAHAVSAKHVGCGCALDSEIDVTTGRPSPLPKPTLPKPSEGIKTGKTTSDGY